MWLNLNETLPASYPDAFAFRQWRTRNKERGAWCLQKPQNSTSTAFQSRRDVRGGSHGGSKKETQLKGVYLNSGDLLLNFWLSIGSLLCHQLITESWPSVSQQLEFLRSFCLTMFTKVITQSKKGGTTPYWSKLNNPYLCFSFFCFSALRKVPWDAKRFRDNGKCPSCQIWHMKAIQLPPWWLPPLSRANKPSNWSPKKEWLSPR